MLKASERTEQRVHPTQKPAALFGWLMEQFTVEGELVVDFFAGSGPCLIAAEKLKRVGYAMEIEPMYCAVILERMAALGLRPTLALA